MQLHSTARRLIGLFRARQTKAEEHMPLPPGGIRLPESDALPALPNTAPAAIHLSTLVSIVYVDAKENESERRITISAIHPKKSGDLLVHSYCHERRAYRAFKASRIVELVDLSTGEVFDDAKNFLSHHVLMLNNDRPGSWLDAVRSELTVLSFFGRCDGHFHPAEQDLIAAHFKNRHDAPPSATQPIIRRANPDERSFFEAMQGLAKAGTLSDLMPVAESLIRADGRVVAEEFHYREEMRNLIAFPPDEGEVLSEIIASLKRGEV